MAIITPGPAVAAISGSVGGTVFSHNRGGMYMRRRAVPLTSTTPDALAAKSYLTEGSQSWQGLTDAQRFSWTAFAQNNPVTNRLGNSIVLTGHQAYVGMFTRCRQALQAPLIVPPIIPAPAPLNTLALSADIGLGTFDITYTPTPLGANERIWLLAAVNDSQGVNFVENQFRLVSVEAAATPSPLDVQTQIEAKFGTLIEGQKVFVKAYVFDHSSGLLSAPLRDQAIVVST